MSFSVDIRSVDDLIEDQDDPIRDVVLRAYGNRPLTAERKGERFFQFSYDAVPPEAVQRVIGDLAVDEPIGLLVEDIPDSDESDPFAPNLFSVRKLARRLTQQYPDVALRNLDEAYQGYERGEYNRDQILAAVLMDFARRPLPGFPVVVFGW
jgi:hypothetical protein